MEVHDLAKSYYEIKTKKEEKRRAIDFNHANTLKQLKSLAHDVDSRLRVIQFENEIRNEEELFEQYSQELREVESELRPILVKVNANTHDRLETKIEGAIHLETYINKEGDIISNSYHKLS